MSLSLPIQWSAHEYDFRKKSPDWFWALGIITVSGTVITFLLQDYLFGIFIILAALSIAYFSLRHPRSILYEINKHGIKIDNYLYPYKTIRQFWIDPEEQTIYKLLIYTERFFMPQMSIPLPNTINPDDLRSTLKELLPEAEIRDSFSHKLLDSFGL